jgi:hypothetical protein
VNANKSKVVCRRYTERKEVALLNPGQGVTMQCAIKTNLT